MSEDVKYTRDVVDAAILHTWVTELRRILEDLDDEFVYSDLTDVVDEMGDFIGVPRE